MELTFEEAGIVLMWVGNEMRTHDLIAAATLDFSGGYEEERKNLSGNLMANGIDDARAIEIAEHVKLDDLVGVTNIVDEV